jgi:uncharacterized coiled-coil protein SlyX
MSDCSYPSCMMGGMGCDRESICDKEESAQGIPLNTELITLTWQPRRGSLEERAMLAFDKRVEELEAKLRAQESELEILRVCHKYSLPLGTHEKKLAEAESLISGLQASIKEFSESSCKANKNLTIATEALEYCSDGDNFNVWAHAREALAKLKGDT